ncbi:MAG: hypothetical protein AAF928_09870, partial [Myxococcota bacterium]
TGASPTLGWDPAIQGSRKDLPVWAGWRYAGRSRVFYAPYARLRFTRFWSLGGAGHLVGVETGLLGLGVYLNDPLGDVAPEARKGRWGVTLEAHAASLEWGANATPNAPSSDEVPSPDAQRAEVERLVASGEVQSVELEQFYPFGGYTFLSFSVPLRLTAWNMVTPTLGVGLFLEINALGFEVPLDRTVDQLAYRYSVVVGPVFRFDRAERGTSSQSSDRSNP